LNLSSERQRKKYHTLSLSLTREAAQRGLLGWCSIEMSRHLVEA
jgi:hypothetical protein